MVKVCVFEARDYEQEALLELVKKGKSEGCEYTFCPSKLDDRTLDFIKGVDVVSILSFSQIDNVMVGHLVENGVKCIATRTIGCDHIDIKATESAGIKVFNASYCPDNVADYAFMLMLMVVRHAKRTLIKLHGNDFSLAGLLGRNLNALTVGVVGLGRSGKGVAERALGFGSRVIAFDPFVKESPIAGVTMVTLTELYNSADVVSLHIPLTADNYHMIDADALSQFKPGAYLINTARGGIVDSRALLSAINSGHLAGAGLDCVEEEHSVMHRSSVNITPDNQLIFDLKNHENIIVTPHSAFFTAEGISAMVNSSIGGAVESVK